jgi:hypothetical protein
MELTNEFVTVRTLTVLKHLGITTLEQLREADLPLFGQIVYYCPLARIRIEYTKKVHKEILELLNS